MQNGWYFRGNSDNRTCGSLGLSADRGNVRLACSVGYAGNCPCVLWRFKKAILDAVAGELQVGTVWSLYRRFRSMWLRICECYIGNTYCLWSDDSSPTPAALKYEEGLESLPVEGMKHNHVVWWELVWWSQQYRGKGQGWDALLCGNSENQGNWVL